MLRRELAPDIRHHRDPYDQIEQAAKLRVKQELAMAAANLKKRN